MLTNNGQKHLLELFLGDSTPKYLMLLNEPDGIDKTVDLKDVTEASERSYKRVKLESNEWSLPMLSFGDAEIVSAEKFFGPFTGDIHATHVALCSVEEGTDGVIYLVSPLKYYVDNKEARKFEAGDRFDVSIAHKSI